MTDQKLLEAAAKAADFEFDWIQDTPRIKCDMGWTPWNPLIDDGDALRLAVKLKLCFGPNFDGDLAVCFGGAGNNITEPFGDDPHAATRRAIVRAAAALATHTEPA